MPGHGDCIKWERPKSVPVPTVWRRCVGLKKMEDGNFPKFVIQDIPEDKHEEIIEFMVEHFCRDEVICECVKILEDQVSMQEFTNLWRELLKQNLALVAYLEDEDGKPTTKIAGCNITGMSYKTDHITHDMVSRQYYCFLTTILIRIIPVIIKNVQPK